MPLLARLAVAAAAGIGAGAAFEPLGFAALLPAAVAVLTWCCVGLRPGRGFLLGTGFGAAFMLVLLPWLRMIGVDAWIALSLLEALFYGLAGLGTAIVARLPGWPVWAASLWVGVEALRGTVPFGGFPWGRLAFGTADTPVAPLFAYVGPAGTTFAVALVGTVLGWAVLHLRRTPVRAVAAVAVGCVAVCLGSIFPPDAAAPDDEPVDPVTVAAVQGNVPGEGMDAFAERRVVLENHVEATRDLAAQVAAGAPQPDFVVWPENSTDIDPFEDASVHADIQGAVDAIGVPVLVGAMVAGESPGEVLNQGIVWHPSSGPGERYAKNHPVPFGEYIPLRDVFAPLIGRLDQIPRDMVAGTEPGLLDLGGTTIGDLICFEVAYDDLLRDVVPDGAEVVVVQTNNATYMGTGQIEQQFAISRLRAIESNRYVVVAATNGVSGIIAPNGDVVERAATRTQQVLLRDVGRPGGTTAGLRFGGLVETGLTALAGVAVLLGWGAGRRHRQGERPAEQRPARSPVGTA